MPYVHHGVPAFGWECPLQVIDARTQFISFLIAAGVAHVFVGKFLGSGSSLFNMRSTKLMVLSVFLFGAWFAHGPCENYDERNSAHWSADASQTGMSLCVGVFVPLRLRLHLHTGVDVIHIVHVCTVARVQKNTSGYSLLGIPYWGAQSPVGIPQCGAYTPPWRPPARE